MNTMQGIEALTRHYAAARKALLLTVDELNERLDKTRSRYIEDIRLGLEDVVKKQEALKRAIEASPELFKKPKTAVFHDIKVGFQKGKGKISWEDDDLLVKRIHRLIPDQAGVVLKTEEVPVKKALEQLDAKVLKKLGITVEDAGDQVVIRPVDSEAEKEIKAMLREMEAKEAA